MQIEEGKYYRTRDGRKVGPAKKHHGGRFEFDGEHPYCHHPDGKYLGQDSSLDLISEWTEGPVRTETVTTRRIVPGVYGRLEVGDRDCSELSIRLAWRTGQDEGELMHPMTATELDDLAMVASQLAEALRDQ